MTLSDIKWGAATIAILALVIIGLGVTVKIQHSTNAQLQTEKKTLTQQKEQAEAITNNVITAVNLINDISRATHDEKETLASDAGTRVVYIRDKLASDACANTVIDNDAVNSLRNYADGLRKATVRPAK
jgi:prophage endopeptidase